MQNYLLISIIYPFLREEDFSLVLRRMLRRSATSKKAKKKKKTVKMNQHFSGIFSPDPPLKKKLIYLLCPVMF